MAVPFVRRARDTSAADARMSDLIRARGVSQANADSRQAALSAGMWGSIINTAGQTMADLAKIQADEPRRKLQEAQTARVQREERKAFEEDEIGRQTAGMPVKDRMEVASGYGRPDVAQQYESDEMRLESSRLELAERRGKRIGDEFTKAGDAIRLMMTIDDPAQKQKLWSDAKQRLVTATDIDPASAASIPDAPPSDPKKLQSYLNMTMTTREKLQTAAEAAKALKDSFREQSDFTKYLSTIVATADTPEAFAAAQQMAETFKVGPLFGSLFGTEYTPDAQKRAKQLLDPTKVDKPENLTPTEQYVKTGDKTVLQRIGDVAAAQRAPETGTDKGTQNRIAAERFRADAMERLARDRATGMRGEDGALRPMSSQEYTDAVSLIDASAGRIASGGVDALKQARGTTTATPSVVGETGKAMSALVKPAAPVVATPAPVAPPPTPTPQVAPSASLPVPEGLKAMLASKPAGKYTDRKTNAVYVKDQQGNITRLR